MDRLVHWHSGSRPTTEPKGIDIIFEAGRSHGTSLFQTLAMCMVSRAIVVHWYEQVGSDASPTYVTLAFSVFCPEIDFAIKRTIHGHLLLERVMTNIDLFVSEALLRPSPGNTHRDVCNCLQLQSSPNK